MAPKPKVTVTLSAPQPKKSVTRFDNTDEGAALANVYVSNAALAEIGNPNAIKVTIEAA